MKNSGTSVTYDAAGNIDTDDRNYDHDNRLTKVTFTGTGGPVEVAHYAYDALGGMATIRQIVSDLASKAREERFFQLGD